MRKIGIMGGTFDPIHIGHLIAAERSMEACGLEEVWLIPNAGPPLKAHSPGAAPEHRLAMAELAAQNHPHFRVVDAELQRGGTSYTYDTIRELEREASNTAFHLIIGTDRIRDLPRWHRIEELAAKVRFIGLDRPEDGTQRDAEDELAALPYPLRKRVVIAPMPQLDISSTAIRNRIRSGLSVRYLVPDSVNDYLMEKGLYRHDG